MPQPHRLVARWLDRRRIAAAGGQDQKVERHSLRFSCLPGQLQLVVTDAQRRVLCHTQQLRSGQRAAVWPVTRPCVPAREACQYARGELEVRGAVNHGHLPRPVLQLQRRLQPCEASTHNHYPRPLRVARPRGGACPHGSERCTTKHTRSKRYRRNGQRERWPEQQWQHSARAGCAARRRVCCMATHAGSAPALEHSALP